MAKITQDEKFLIKLYDLAKATNDVFSKIDMFAIGKEAHIREKAVKIIIRNLAQANFIKKAENDLIYLTVNGISLVEELTMK